MQIVEAYEEIASEYGGWIEPSLWRKHPWDSPELPGSLCEAIETRAKSLGVEPEAWLNDLLSSALGIELQAGEALEKIVQLRNIG